MARIGERSYERKGLFDTRRGFHLDGGKGVEGEGMASHQINGIPIDFSCTCFSTYNHNCPIHGAAYSLRMATAKALNEFVSENIRRDMADEFKLGDRVWDFAYGWGEVREMDGGDGYPVHVYFTDIGFSRRYTIDGKPASLYNRTLFFAEIPVPESALKRPRPELKVDTPVLVRDGENDKWLRRYFAGWDEDGLIRVFSYGKTSWTNNDDCVVSTFNCWKLPEESDD
jgi:hypothetical protein